jgi:N-acetylneuraminic acid mutarotase
MNDAANWGRLVSSYGGNIYSYAEKSGGFLKYDPTAKIFSNLPTPPNSTWGSVSLWLNGKYYLIGGYQSSKTVSYDPNTNTWSTLADAPRQGFFQAVALNGKIYLIGGTSGGLVRQ